MKKESSKILIGRDRLSYLGFLNDKRKALVSGCILIIVVILLMIPTTVLEVFIADKGDDYNKVIYTVRANENDTFSVYWTHSVSLRPVIETFKIKEDYNISVEEMIFDTFSANLPASPDYNTKWEYHDDYIRVYNYDLEFDALPVVIGKVHANHKLIYNDKTIVLKDLYKPGGFVKIRARKLNNLHYMWRRLTTSE